MVCLGCWSCRTSEALVSWLAVCFLSHENSARLESAAQVMTGRQGQCRAQPAPWTQGHGQYICQLAKHAQFCQHPQQGRQGNGLRPQQHNGQHSKTTMSLSLATAAARKTKNEFDTTAAEWATGEDYAHGVVFIVSSSCIRLVLVWE
jgi:hypothetical protein